MKGSFKNDKRNFERGNLEGRATRTGRRRNFPRFKKGSQIHADGLLRQDDKAQLDTLTRAWGKIHVDQSWGAKDNKYYLGDRQISRHEAFLHIAKATGQDMPDISY